MAIEQTNVYSTNIETNVRSLASWMQSNSTGYFDGVEVVTDGLNNAGSEFGIRCTVDGNEFLMLEFDRYTLTSIHVSTENDVSRMLITASESPLYAYKCYKLSTGIVIQFAGSEPTDDSNFAFAITKDNDRNTVFICNNEFANSVEPSSPTYIVSRKTIKAELSESIVITEKRGKTALSPLVVYDDADRTVPNAFAVPYYQHTVEVLSKITIDGKEAIYCCGWLLKE